MVSQTWRAPLPFAAANIVIDGNSLSTSDYATSYPSQLAEMLAAYSPVVTNKAVSGQSTTMMAADAASEIDPLYVEGKRNILIAWEVGNEIGGVGINQAYQNMRDYSNGRRNRGWETIILTCIPRINVSDSLLVPANTLMLSNWFTFCDAIVDLRADARLQTITGTYYTGDSVHLNSTGNAVVALSVYNVLKNKYGLQ